ncbi:MAG: baseplate J/gp47 family protein [Chloroflexales bacterium]
MAEIKQVHGRAVLDYMARDYDSLLAAMRERIPELLPEWTDYTSEADFGNVLLETFAAMGDILSYYQDRIAGESFLGTAQSRRSSIQHLRLIGYRLATAAPAAAALTLLFPKSYSGTVTIRKGDTFATRSQPDRPPVSFEYTGDVALEIVCDGALPETSDPATQRSYRYYGPDPFAPPPPAGAPRPAGIPVEEGRLILSERLGVSDGTPNQRFPLAHPQLILRPPSQDQAVNRDLVLLVEYGQQVDRWSLRDTLAFSRDDQQDFVVEIDADDRASVLFGDGRFGKVPLRGALIKATYRVGGGVQGNLPARMITTVASAPQLSLAGVAVTNAAPATGGAARESIEHAVAQAPAVFRARSRAVTQADYQALACNFQGVGKARAVATHWNVVRLHVAPAGGGAISDTLRAGLLAYFEDKRPITTRIEIAGVDDVPISVTAKIAVEPYYSDADVRARVLAAVGQLLVFDNVDFGQTIYLSKFYEAIEAIDGVRYVTISEFHRDQSPTGQLGNGLITLGPNEIPYAGSVVVEIVTPVGGA